MGGVDRSVRPRGGGCRCRAGSDARHEGAATPAHPRWVATPRRGACLGAGVPGGPVGGRRWGDRAGVGTCDRSEAPRTERRCAARSSRRGRRGGRPRRRRTAQLGARARGRDRVGPVVGRSPAAARTGRAAGTGGAASPGDRALRWGWARGGARLRGRLHTARGVDGGVARAPDGGARRALAQGGWDCPARAGLARRNGWLGVRGFRVGWLGVPGWSGTCRTGGASDGPRAAGRASRPPGRPARALRVRVERRHVPLQGRRVWVDRLRVWADRLRVRVEGCRPGAAGRIDRAAGLTRVPDVRGSRI